MLGQRILLDVIGAAVIGGVSLFGGKGKVIWTVFGALFLTVVDKGLQLLGLSLASVFAIKGGGDPAGGGRSTRRASASPRGSEPIERGPLWPCSIEDLCKSFFGVQVLHDVGSRARAGPVLGLVGENGSGKSTTMNILGGVHQPDRGRMTARRRSPMRRAARKDAAGRGIAFIHQELNLFQNLRSRRTCSSPASRKLVRGLPLHRPAQGARAGRRELLARSTRHRARHAGRPPQPGRAPAGRDRQGAGRGGAGSIIFDEPTTSLTARERPSGCSASSSGCAAQGIAIIYISHILGDVMRLCDDIVVLRDGHVVGAGPAPR